MQSRRKEVLWVLLAVLLWTQQGAPLQASPGEGPAIRLMIVRPSPGESVDPRPTLIIKAVPGFMPQVEPIVVFVDGFPWPADVTYGQGTAIARLQRTLDPGAHQVVIESAHGSAFVAGDAVDFIVTGLRAETNLSWFQIDGWIGAKATGDDRTAGAKLPFDLTWQLTESTGVSGFGQGSLTFPSLTASGLVGAEQLQIDRWQAVARTDRREYVVGDRAFYGESPLIFGKLPLRGAGMFPDAQMAGSFGFAGRDIQGQMVSILGMQRPVQRGVRRGLLVLPTTGGGVTSYALQAVDRAGSWSGILEVAGGLSGNSGFLPHQAVKVGLQRTEYPVWNIEGAWVGEAFRRVNALSTPGLSLSIRRSAPVAFAASISPDGPGKSQWKLAWSGPFSVRRSTGFLEGGWTGTSAKSVEGHPFASLTLRYRASGDIRFRLDGTVNGFRRMQHQGKGVIEVQRRGEFWRVGGRFWTGEDRNGQLLQTRRGVETFVGRRIGPNSEVLVRLEETRRTAALLPAQAVRTANLALEIRFKTEINENTLETRFPD